MDIKTILNLSPEDLIRSVEAGDISDAIVYSFPLDTARINFSVEISGNFIACISGQDSAGGVDATVNADLQFNKVEPNNQNSINFSQGLQMTRPFARFYITNAAQAGKVIKFLISTTAPLFSVTDNRSQGGTAVALSGILDQMQGQLAAGTFVSDVSVTGIANVCAAAAARRAAFIFADKANTDDIYIGFDNSTTSAKKIIALGAGDSFSVDDYRGDIFAIANSGTQKLSISNW